MRYNTRCEWFYNLSGIFTVKIKSNRKHIGTAYTCLLPASISARIYSAKRIVQYAVPSALPILP